MKQLGYLTFITISIVFGAASPVGAQTVRRVPTDFLSIQSAVNASSTGDIVRIVADGTYDPFVLLGDVLVESDSTTTERDAVIVSRTTGTYAAEIRAGHVKRITFDGANGTYSVIKAQESTALIEDCWIRNGNYGLGYGCGNLEVRDCLFTDLDTQAITALPPLDGPEACFDTHPTRETSFTMDGCVIVGAEAYIYDVWDASVMRTTFDGDGRNSFALGGDFLRYSFGVAECIFVDFDQPYFGVFDLAECPTLIRYNLLYDAFAGYCNIGSSTNLVGVDPLFCEEREASVEKYTLRIDSRAAQENSPFGVPMGARPVECAWGTLSDQTTVGAGGVKVLEDVIIPDGLSLTLLPGTILRFDTVDESNGGGYEDKNELLVEDGASLYADAGGGERVVFTSLGNPPYPSDWGRIAVFGGAHVEMDHALVEDADIGLHYLSDDSTNVLKDVVFQNNTLEDVRVDEAFTGPDGPRGTFEECTYNSSGAYGVRVNYGAEHLLFADCEFNGSSVPIAGLAWDFSGGTVDGGSISGFTAGTGVRAKNAVAPLVKEVTFSNNKYAAEWQNTAAGEIRSCTFGQGASAQPYGVWVRNSAAPTIDLNTFGTATNGIGIRVDDSADPEVGPDNSLSDQVIGISAQGTSSGIFRGNTVSDCTYAFSVVNTAHPDLGTQLNPGNNNVTGSGNYHVLSRGRADTLFAELNWWGSNFPIPTMFSALVDYDPWLSAPASAQGIRGLASREELVDRGMRLQVGPNPTRGRVQFRLRTSGSGSGMMTIVDMAGRLVRSIPFAASSGLVDVTWDGTTERGVRAPTGIYLYRMRMDGIEETGRLTVLR